MQTMARNTFKEKIILTFNLFMDILGSLLLPHDNAIGLQVAQVNGFPLLYNIRMRCQE